jgi:hypothetical protein
MAESGHQQRNEQEEGGGFIHSIAAVIWSISAQWMTNEFLARAK